jgi:hypothetical protein
MSFTGLPGPGELRELVGSREIVVNRRGMTGYRKFLTRWDEQDVNFTGTSPLGSAFPGYAYLRMVQYKIAPYGNTTGGGAGFEYDCALIECEYATLTGPDDAPTATWEGTCEVLNTGRGRLWLSDSSAVKDTPINLYLGLEVATFEYSVASDAIPEAVRTYRNKVNSVEFANHPAGYVLYDSFSSRNEWDADLGEYRARLALRFVIQSDKHAWNEAWRDDLGDWDETSPALYEEADLNDLIPS